MTQTEQATTGNGLFDQVRDILVQSLQLQEGELELTSETELLGNIPEMDSMTVVTILTTIEEQFGIDIDDSEISAETFETLGTLVEFVQEKCAE